jgi:hypothetical protein
MGSSQTPEPRPAPANFAAKVRQEQERYAAENFQEIPNTVSGPKPAQPNPPRPQPTSGDSTPEDGSTRFPHLSSELRRKYTHFAGTSKDTLKSIIDEVALAKAILDNFRLVTHDLKCGCGGTYQCNSCGQTVTLDNSERLLNMADQVTKLVERLNKIEDGQRIYVTFTANVIAAYMQQLLPIIQEYVRDPADIARLSEDVDKFSSSFSEFGLEKLGLTEPETGTRH